MLAACKKPTGRFNLESKHECLFITHAIRFINANPDAVNQPKNFTGKYIRERCKPGCTKIQAELISRR